ncbi:MAG: hypothetical protein WCP39_00260 [Chlamydiota bacterium]
MQYLTNERLKNKFENNFVMVNFAIHIAWEAIKNQQPKELDEIITELIVLPPKV